MSFHILDAHLSDVGDSATVKILRTDNFPGFPNSWITRPAKPGSELRDSGILCCRPSRVGEHAFVGRCDLVVDRVKIHRRRHPRNCYRSTRRTSILTKPERRLKWLSRRRIRRAQNQRKPRRKKSPTPRIRTNRLRRNHSPNAEVTFF